MTFYERLQSLMDSHNLTQKQLADCCNMRQANISEWKKNGNFPSGEIAIRIADYFNISIDYLLTGKEENLTQEETELLSNYRKLDANTKKIINLQVAAVANVLKSK